MELKEAFEEFDSDGSGRISAPELHQAIKSLVHRVPKTNNINTTRRHDWSSFFELDFFHESTSS